MHGVDDGGLVPVEVGLGRLRTGGGTTGRMSSSQVQAGAVMSKVDTQLLGGPPSGPGSRQTYQLRWALSRRRAGVDEPGVLVGRVVGHPVDDDPQAETVGILEKRVEVGQRAEDGVDVAVVGDVVAEVGHGGGEERGQPQGVDAQPGEVVEVGTDAVEVADAVAVGVGERAGIDLVDDGPLPPRGSVTRPSRAPEEEGPARCRSRAERRRPVDERHALTLPTPSRPCLADRAEPPSASPAAASHGGPSPPAGTRSRAHPRRPVVGRPHGVQFFRQACRRSPWTEVAAPRCCGIERGRERDGGTPDGRGRVALGRRAVGQRDATPRVRHGPGVRRARAVPCGCPATTAPTGARCTRARCRPIVPFDPPSASAVVGGIRRAASVTRACREEAA